MSSTPLSGDREICVLLDSNFLLVPILFRIDIFEEIPRIVERRVNFVLLRPVYEEVEQLAKEGRPKLKKDMSSALELCKSRCHIMDFRISSGETVDELLMRATGELGCPIATNDTALRRRLREKGTPVIYLRQKSHLKMDGWIQS